MFSLTTPIVIALFLVVRVMAQDKSQDSPPEQRTLSVCDVLSSPMKYNGQLVTIRGVSEGTEEGWWIGADKTCPNPLVTNSYAWPSIIWVQAVGGHEHNPKAGLQTDQKALSKVDRDLRLMRIDPKTDRIWLSFTGVLETREFTPKDVGKADGQWRASGYGHLGSAPAQLLLKTVGDLHVERSTAQH